MPVPVKENCLKDVCEVEKEERILNKESRDEAVERDELDVKMEAVKENGTSVVDLSPSSSVKDPEELMEEEDMNEPALPPYDPDVPIGRPHESFIFSPSFIII